MNDLNTKSPFKICNVRYFIAFRVFFNARFYYPVFTILFLDFGLTLQQFALLNVAWAATIVLLEVPSGALADTIGRRNLLVCAGALMVVEIALLCFAPMGNLNLLFAIFLVNRVLSGAAEAAASGADEAIAYDSLKKEGQVSDWGAVLEKQMRLQSIAYIGALSLGAAVYDPVLMGRVGHWLGLNIRFTQDLTLRFPLFLTLLMAIITLITTLRMKDVCDGDDAEIEMDEGRGNAIIQSFKLTFKAGRWILDTPFALVIILSTLVFDHSIRMVITLNSQYYRLIHLPEASFGLIGSGMAVLGIFIPRIARKMAERRSPTANLGVMFVLTLVGLLVMTLFLPVIGLFSILLLFCSMYLLRFFSSYYLNRITNSSQRATVLSFNGLLLNLAYGLIGLLYSLLLAILRSRALENQLNLDGQSLENVLFTKSISFFPWYFLLTFIALWLFARWKLRGSDEHKKPGVDFVD
ncbi:MAG: MFS transporter [Deltaproteobacteria bacterium]|nr:MFS transporter [Deltaproteobacteria bacterium]